MPGLDPRSRRNAIPAAANGFAETAGGIHVFLAAPTGFNMIGP